MYHIEVMGSIPAANMIFSAGLMMLLLSFHLLLETIIHCTVCRWQTSSQENDPIKIGKNVNKLFHLA